jgi:hypothetical protein
MNVINVGDRGSVHDGIYQDPVTGQTRFQTPLERRAALFEAVRAQCLEYLLPALKPLFDNANNLLFDLARKSESYVTQRAYFEAMQEIHRQRACMESRFKSEFLAVFDQLYQRAAAASAASPAVIGSKPDPDDGGAKEQLAITNLIEKIQQTCHQDISDLNRRLGVLLGSPKFATEENPAGPASIGKAIKASMSLVRVGGFIRLFMIALFDRHLTGPIQTLYRALNEFLINQQVLPEIRVPEIQLGSFTDLPHLPAGTASTGISPPPAIINIELVRALTALQRGGYAPPEGVADCAIFNMVRDIKIRNLLPRLDQTNEVTLDIVAMLFDYFLHDEQLSVALRMLIASLQIPCLKVAFIDRDFFIKNSHPARRLLNMIAQTGIEGAEDAGFQKTLINLVTPAIRRIQNEFEEDVSLFAILQMQLEQDIAATQRESILRTGRTTRVSSDSARQEQAKRRIRMLIGARLDHASPDSPAIPEAVRNFILTHWQHLLILHFVRDGVDGASLNDAIHTLDDLIWSVAPKRDAGERDRLNRLRPDLIRCLDQGMDRLALPQLARAGFWNKLAKCHAEAMGRQPAVATTINAISESASLVIAAALFEDPVYPATQAGGCLSENSGAEHPLLHGRLFDGHPTDQRAATGFDSEEITTPREFFPR